MKEVECNDDAVSWAPGTVARRLLLVADFATESAYCVASTIQATDKDSCFAQTKSRDRRSDRITKRLSGSETYQQPPPRVQPHASDLQLRLPSQLSHLRPVPGL